MSTPVPVKSRSQRERILPSLALVEFCYVVGKRRLLSELSSEKQSQIRQAYAETDWCSDAGLELLGVYTDLDAAKQKSSIEGHFYLQLPVNASLLEALGRYGIQDFPTSSASDMYLSTSPGMELVPRHLVDQLATRVEGACEKAGIEKST